METRYNNQHKFTEHVLNKLGCTLPLSDKDKVQWTKEYLLCIVSECMEVLEKLNWKHHKNETKEVNLTELGIEIVDIQKFLWGLLKIWGFSYSDFIELYDLKTIEVEKLWHQEHTLEKLSTKDKICVVDIDGVLTDYPKCFYDWVKNNYDIKIDKETTNPVEYARYKELYRKSGYKRNLPIIESSKEALIKLKNLGYTIVILTNRPYKKYTRLYTDTVLWLNKNEIPYDYIYWSEEEKVLSIIDKCNHIDLFIDDNYNNCKEFELVGIKSYWYNGTHDNNLIKKIDNLLNMEELDGHQ